MNKKQLYNSLKEHIINLYNRDYKISTIANIYGVSRQTIYNIVNNYKKNKTIERKKGSGRKKDENTKEKIIDIIKKDKNLSINQISAILFKKYKIKKSKTSVYEYLIDNDYVNKKSIKKPLLTQNHKCNREIWTIFYKDFDWSTVIWSDESAISIQQNTLSKVWINKNDKDIKRVVKYPLKIHIWGCILKNHKLIIHIYDKTMNGDKYIEILKLKLLPLIQSLTDGNNNKYIFQQDNASCHKCLKVKNFFSENNIDVMLWPANSPDLNPIENVWNLIKKNIGKIYITNKEELINRINEEAKNLDITIINNIIGSMNNRINELINNSFDYINY